MRKKTIILFLLVFLFTGCSVVNINTDNYLNNINNIIKRNNKYTSDNAIGYQYKLPVGVTKIESNEFNEVLLSNNEKYYLYADVVSYYYKVENKYKVDKKAFLSSELKNKDKYGYVEVNEDNGKYYVEMMYNYSKIESYINKKDLRDTLNNMAYILSSIKYNDSVITNLLGDEKYNLSANQKYNIFNVKKNNTNTFLKYERDYDNYNGVDASKELIEKKEIERDTN
ncbi:MAG: hypothetical protein IKF37_02800 [Bacilli bacterium]|nr:hypothetical protein [Bacilli bacterium]